MTDLPDSETVESILDDAARGPWQLEDYTLNAASDGSTLTIELTHTGVPEPDEFDSDVTVAVKPIVERLEGDSGAAVGDVVDAANAPEEYVRKKIDHLRTLGEVYEPKQGHLRAT